MNFDANTVRRETIRGLRSILYRSSSPKKRQQIMAEPQAPGQVKIFTRIEISFYKKEKGL